MPERKVYEMPQNLNNTRVKDSSGKLIFGDPILCSQFLRGYLDIPMLKDVQPEDIEDVTERFVHMFTEERNSDVIKKVHLKKSEMPFCFISLIEHKSEVDYNVVMQILRYMVFIWEDYEKEAERAHREISKTKGFKYPPILPILFYDGPENWTADLRLHDRINCSDMLKEYIPDYCCFPVQLKDYSNIQLMEKRDELSVLMMFDKLYSTADLERMNREIDPQYMKDVTENTPEYLLTDMAQIVERLLLRINVPFEEAEDMAEQIKERRMGEWCANFKGYDVQETRRLAREEAREEAIAQAIKMMKEASVSREVTKQQLVKQFGLDPQEAEEKLKANW